MWSPLGYVLIGCRRDFMAQTKRDHLFRHVAEHLARYASIDEVAGLSLPSPDALSNG